MATSSTTEHPEIHLSDTNPAAPGGHVNVKWQIDEGQNPPDVSANIDIMTGDSGSGGAAGLAPAPGAGDAAAGKFLKADGTWEEPSSSGSLAGDSDVTISSPTDGDLLTYVASASKWENKPAAGGGSSNATQLQGSDISSASPLDTQQLRWNAATSKWEPSHAPIVFKRFCCALSGAQNAVFGLVMQNFTGPSIQAPTATEPVLNRYATSGTGAEIVGNASNDSNSFGYITPGTMAYAYFRIRAKTTGSPARYWIGLWDQHSAQPTTSNLIKDDPSTLHVVGFRFSTNASDTHWQAYCSNGSASTITDTGVAPDTTNSQKFLILYDAGSSSMKFYINGALVATITTHLPATSQGLSPVFTVDTIGTNGTTNLRQLDFAYFELGSFV